MCRRNGFVLLAVIALLPLVALAIVIVATTGQTMRYQTTDALLRAQAHNLDATALAWLDHNGQTLSTGSAHELDATDFGTGALCRIERLESSADGAARFRVTIRCTRRRQVAEQVFMATHPAGDPRWQIVPTQPEPTQVIPADPNT